jgi:lipid A 3-O-deacylase
MKSSLSIFRPNISRLFSTKLAAALFLCLGFATALRAQSADQTSAPTASQAPSTAAPQDSQLQSLQKDTWGDFRAQSLKKGAWELGVLAGGGTGLGKSDNTQFFYAGGRVGYILTGEHLPGLLRGNFEWAVDVLPLYPVLTPDGGAIYGASIKPAIWEWNFTSFKKFAPYVAAAGGVVFSKSNVPPGDTSQINFTPQFVVGSHYFFERKRALFFEGSLGHLSSASLGPHNPGYNVTFVFTVGLSWMKGGH